ncbi:MAG: GAF domain-containing protein [Chloroflexota bacterium]
MSNPESPRTPSDNRDGTSRSAPVDAGKTPAGKSRGAGPAPGSEGGPPSEDTQERLKRLFADIEPGDVNPDGSLIGEAPTPSSERARASAAKSGRREKPAQARPAPVRDASLSMHSGVQVISAGTPSSQALTSSETEPASSSEQWQPADSILTALGWRSLRAVTPLTQTQDPPAVAYARPFMQQEVGKRSGAEQADTDSLLSPAAQSLLLEVLDENNPTRLWSEDELLLLEQVTDQLSLALENARLHAETRQQLQMQLALRQSTAAINASLELKQVLSQLAEQIVVALDLTSAYVCALEAHQPDTDDVSSMRSTVLAEYYSVQASSEERLPDVDQTYLQTDAVRHGTGLLEQLRQGEMWVEQASDPDLPEVRRQHYQKLGVQSVLFAPLFVRGQLYGYIEMWESRASRQFNVQERLLCGDISQQAATAIERARLFEESRRRAEQLAVLNEMSRTLSSQLEVEDVLNTVYTYATRLIPLPNFYVALYDSQAEQVSFPIAYEIDPGAADGPPQRLHWQPRTLGNGLTEYIIHNRQPVLISRDVDQFIHQELGIELVGREQAQSWLGVPMLYGERVIGVIGVQSYTQPGLYQEEHRDLLNAIASQAAVALENARLFQQTQDALATVEISARYQKSVAQAVATLTERGMAALPEVLRILGQAANANRAYYFETFETEPANETAPRRFYWRLVSDWFTPGLSSQTNNPVLRKLSTRFIQPWLERLSSQESVAVIISQLPEPIQEFFKPFGTRSILQFPVTGRYEIPGCIGFEQVDSDRVWTADEISALQTAASALANTLAREDLFNQVQINLAETEALYQASARLNTVASFDDILAVLRRHTILGNINAAHITINVFDTPQTTVGAGLRPAPDQSTPAFTAKSLIPVAFWDNSRPAGKATSNFPAAISLDRWPNADQVIFPDRLSTILDAGGDPRLGDNLRERYVEALKVHSLLLVPLNVAGRWIGEIIAAYQSTTAFPENELRRLSTVSGQAAIALENLRLLEETRQRNEQLAALNQITSAASRTLDLNQMLAEILQRILDLFDFGSGLVSLAEPDSSELRLAVHHNLPEHLLARLRQLSSAGSMAGSACELVYLEAHSIYAPDILDLPAELTASIKPEALQTAFGALQESGFRSYLGVPLESKGAILGVVSAFHSQTSNLTPDRLSLLQAIGQQVGVVVENARLFQSTQRALMETESLYQASAGLSGVRNYEEIISTLDLFTVLGHADKLLSLVLFDRPWQDRNDPPEWMTAVAYRTLLAEERLRHRYATRDFPAIRLLSANQAVIVVDIENDPRLDENVRQLYLTNFEGRSTLFVPLVVGGQWIGYINGIYGELTTFAEADVRRLLALAGQAAVAVQNLSSLQLAQQRAREAQERSEELALINRIVSSVATSLDLRSSLEVAAREMGQALNAQIGIALFDEIASATQGAEGGLVVVASYSPLAEAPSPIGVKIPIRDNLSTEEVIRTRRTLVITDPQHDPLTASVHELMRNRQVQTLMIIPIIASNQIIGTIGVDILELDRQLTPDEIRLAETIVLQTATAIQNSRLFDQTQTILQETEALYQASAKFQVAQNFTQILEALRQYTVLGQDSFSVSIDLYDQPIPLETGGDQIDAAAPAIPEWAHTNIPEWATTLARWGSPPPDTLADSTGMERYPLRAFPALAAELSPYHVTLIEDIANDARLDGETRRLYVELFMARSTAFAPLVVGGEWIGHINALYSEKTVFGPQESRRLMALAGQAAVAVQTLRLLEETRRRAGQLQTAAEIARDTSSTLALEALLNRVVNLLRERFGYYHASVFLLDESQTQALIYESTGLAGAEMKRRGHRLEVGSQSVIGQTTLTGAPVVLNDVRLSEAKMSGNLIHRFNPLLPDTRAELGLPLKIGERVIGALDVQADRPNAFSEDDVAVLQILADQVAVAVDNARAYELTQKAVEEIREADRLKTQFLANMSHELRTPLNSIIGFSRVILKGIDGPITDQQQQDLNAIYNSGQHLLGLINDVLDLSRIEAGKMEMAFEDGVNLAEIINGVMSTTIGLVKDKPIQLRKDIPPDLPLLRIDPMKIRQVLLNLLANAAKFTEEGSITVQTRVQNGRQDQPEVLVKVIDTGPGIAPEDQSKLFQPFSQVDASLTRKTGGSGLGLSICQHLIRLHNGEIGIQSEVGKGSSFYFTLPLTAEIVPPPDEAGATRLRGDGAQPELPETPHLRQDTPDSSKPPAPKPEATPNAAAEAAAQPKVELPSGGAAPNPSGQVAVPLPAEAEAQPVSAPAQVEPAPGASSVAGDAADTASSSSATTILLAIDKDPQIVDLYRRFLSGYNVTVIALNELDQAVTVARGIQPFAITLDVAMRSTVATSTGLLDGWQVLKALKLDPQIKDVPVIVCTILDEQERAMRLGANDFLLKPILADDLAQAIRRLRENRSKSNPPERSR